MDALLFQPATDFWIPLSALGAFGAFSIALVAAVLRLMDDRRDARDAEKAIVVKAEQEEIATDQAAEARLLAIENTQATLIAAFRGTDATAFLARQPGVLERLSNLEAGQGSIVRSVDSLTSAIGKLVEQGAK